ncbi:MAG: hypothetical protein J7M21_00245, partial [Planctomycetes bacterium]|nr:hypothetical protein [Planctomycetota bacterium]
VEEVAGEKIDIVRYHDSPTVFIANALKPAEVREILLNRDINRATVLVSEDQLSLAIGKRGQNVRLAARLTGWDIDILTPSEFNAGLDLLEKSLREVEGVDSTIVDKIVAMGMVSVLDVEEVGPEPLINELDLDRQLAQQIVVRCAEAAKAAAEKQAAEAEAKKQAAEAERKAAAEKQAAQADEHSPAEQVSAGTPAAEAPEETAPAGTHAAQEAPQPTPAGGQASAGEGTGQLSDQDEPPPADTPPGGEAGSEAGGEAPGEAGGKAGGETAGAGEATATNAAEGPAEGLAEGQAPGGGSQAPRPAGGGES